MWSPLCINQAIANPAADNPISVAKSRNLSELKELLLSAEIGYQPAVGDMVDRDLSEVFRENID